VPSPARPFRAEHVGSLLRPERLRQAREDHLAGKCDAAALARLEDEAIRETVAMQERVGLQVVTDGEFRRANWRDGFFLNVDGFSRERQPTTFEFRMFDGTTRKATPVPTVEGRLKRRAGIATGEFAFLREAASRTAKITLPAPSVMHFFGGPAAIRGPVYDGVEPYMADVAAIYREELDALGRAGCRYVQFDDVALPLLCDPAVRRMLEERGEDVDRVIDLYVATLNEAHLRGRPG
jgi:5-methyltetrahydropteroyltriglutamate--homocysteine methyltransferase